MAQEMFWTPKDTNFHCDTDKLILKKLEIKWSTQYMFEGLEVSTFNANSDLVTVPQIFPREEFKRTYTYAHRYGT